MAAISRSVDPSGLFLSLSSIPTKNKGNGHLSLRVRKPTICLCENKDADQLCSNCTADQRLCIRYSDSTIPSSPQIQNFKLLTIFCDCAGRFVSDLVVYPNCWFSHAQAHFRLGIDYSATFLCKPNYMKNSTTLETNGGPRGRVVKVADFSALNHSIISPLHGFAPRSGHESHVGQAKFCLRVCQVVFPRVLRFSPNFLPIDSSRYE